MADLSTALMMSQNAGQHPRSIGGIIAQVTIEERSTDEVIITEHPVEQGASISDHAYKRPAEVTLRCGWSEARSGNLTAYGGIYNLLLSWQAALNPFDLYTGLRKFPNMLIAGITIVTNQETAHVLIAEIRCKEVILVSTSTVTTATPGLASSSDQQSPDQTSQTIPTGNNQLDINSSTVSYVPTPTNSGYNSGLPVSSGSTGVQGVFNPNVDLSRSTDLSLGSTLVGFNAEVSSHTL